jgi:hypothetical protein
MSQSTTGSFGGVPGTVTQSLKVMTGGAVGGDGDGGVTGSRDGADGPPPPHPTAKRASRQRTRISGPFIESPLIRPHETRSAGRRPGPRTWTRDARVRADQWAVRHAGSTTTLQRIWTPPSTLNETRTTV